MKIYLYRHGKTTGNLYKKYIGRTDEPLDEQYTYEITRQEAEPKMVFVSSLLRSKQSAFIMFPCAKQISLRGLDEMDFGIFENKNYEELKNIPEYNAWVDSWCEDKVPGGEKKSEFCKRVVDTFVLNIFSCGEDEVYVVAHGGTIMAILDAFSFPHRDYYDWKVPNGGGFSADWDGTRLINIERISVDK